MRYFWSLIGLVLSIWSFYYFLDFLPANITETIFANDKVFIMVLPLLLVSYYVRGYKSLYLLKVKDEKFSVYGSLFFSISLNNILPFRLGDVLRLFFLQKFVSVSLSRATSALLVERVVDLITMFVLLLIVSIAIQPDLMLFYRGTFLTLFLKNAQLIFILSIVSILTFYFFGKKIFLVIIEPAFKVIDLTFNRLIKLFCLSGLQWCLEIILLSWLLSKFFGEIPTDGSVLSAFFCNLSTLVPSAPGYVGTFEVAGLIPFKLLGYNITTNYSVYIVTYHLVIWLFSTSIGLIFSLSVIKRITANKSVAITL